MKYSASSLKRTISDVLQRCSTEGHTIIYEGQKFENVQLLLMTVNDNEFYATLYYMANKHKDEDFNIPKSLTIDDGTRFFVGNFANIPAALVQQHKSGSAVSQYVASKAMEVFDNLKAIVAVGVCGTFEELGDVIVSSEIVGYDDAMYGKDGKILTQNLASSSSHVLLNFLQAQYNWEFNCTNDTSSVQCLSQLHYKPFLSASTLAAHQAFRDKIREDVCREAVGIEMEGIGVVKAKELNKRSEVHFIIVKAGCDYANEEKNKEWQPVAAMAAADFLYFQFSKLAPNKWFRGTCVYMYICSYVHIMHCIVCIQYTNMYSKVDIQSVSIHFTLIFQAHLT